MIVFDTNVVSERFRPEAAICISRSATLATRNVKDFEGFGIPLINPWKD